MYNKYEEVLLVSRGSWGWCDDEKYEVEGSSDDASSTSNQWCRLAKIDKATSTSRSSNTADSTTSHADHKRAKGFQPLRGESSFKCTSLLYTWARGRKNTFLPPSVFPWFSTGSFASSSAVLPERGGHSSARAAVVGHDAGSVLLEAGGGGGGGGGGRQLQARHGALELIHVALQVGSPGRCDLGGPKLEVEVEADDLSFIGTITRGQGEPSHTISSEQAAVVLLEARTCTYTAIELARLPPFCSFAPTRKLPHTGSYYM